MPVEAFGEVGCIEPYKKTKGEIKMKKLKILLTLCSAVATFSFLHSAEQINQQVDAQGIVVHDNFQENIVAKAFDRYTGNFYVGTAINNNAYSIARASRIDTGFTGLAVGDAIGAVTSPNISLINEAANAAATLLAFKNDAGTATDLKVMQLIENYPLFNVSPGAAAANNNLYCLADGTAAENFSRIAGGYKSGDNSGGYIFIRTYPNTGDGSTSSGILAYKKNDAGNDLVRVGRIDLPANPDNIAAKLDDKRGAIGDGSFLRFGSFTAEIDPNPKVKDMYWDDELQTLFIAGSVSATDPGADQNYYLGLTQVKFDGANLKISDIIGNGINAAANDNTTIFASRVNAGAASLNVRMHKVRTMKTSTDRNYLIVNGSIQPDGGQHEFENQFYALQYSNNTGFIVQNDNDKTALVDGFIRTGGADPGQSLDGGKEGSLVIGGEDAPWQAANGSASDMEVVGDTVYVSFKGANRDGDNDPGVWSSSALFDNDGVIIGWTKWERVFTSAATPNFADKSYFFSVDGKTGQLWQVNESAANQPKIVNRTKITTSDFPENSLQKKINADFADGCTCVLDLPKNTPGIAGQNNPSNSFVLFGGIEKVAFAQTKSGALNAVTTNFTDFYIKTDLPAGAGVVRCLGFSRNTDNLTQGYFFAGTDNGLYVYAATAEDHEGFNGAPGNAVGLKTIADAPFDNNHKWLQISTNNITGAVSSIESDGENIFVVEQDTTVKNSAISRIWKFGLQDNVTTLENGIEKIAESGIADIPPNAIITGLKLITDVNGAFGQHAGVISTNAGIFRTENSIPLSLIVPTDLAAIPWVAVGENKAYHSAYSPKRTPIAGNDQDGVNHNVWAIALADDDKNLGYYQNSTLHQFGFPSELNNGAATPEHFTNGDMDSDPNPLEYIDRTTNFWTDGGRRFYTRFDTQGNINNSLRSLPYYAKEWAMTHPESFPELSSISRIYWMENISALGMVLAGTDDGVISLVE